MGYNLVSMELNTDWVTILGRGGTDRGVGKGTNAVRGFLGLLSRHTSSHLPRSQREGIEVGVRSGKKGTAFTAQKRRGVSRRGEELVEEYLYQTSHKSQSTGI